MHPTVRVVQPDRTPLYLIITEPLVVGRECDGLLLADDKVSRQHLRISPAGDGSIIASDLGSTNGSFVDQQRIQGDASVAPGSVLTIGDTAITVEMPPQATATRPATGRDVGGTIVARLPATPDAAPSRATSARTPGFAPTPPTSAPPPPMPTSAADADQTAPPMPPMAPMPDPGAAGHPPAAVKPQLTASSETRRTSMDAIAASFSGQLNMPSGAADDTVTIMFSDIESSTELALSMGDHQWYEILTWHNQLIEHRVAAHGGFIVKNQGDGFMVTFNSARRAIICASEIQQALHEHAQTDPASAIRVRIGLHTGEAIRQDSGDLFGRHVIIAARVGGLAHGAQILVSSIVREIASARGDLHFGESTMVELKGVGDQLVYPVLWGTDLPSA